MLFHLTAQQLLQPTVEPFVSLAQMCLRDMFVAPRCVESGLFVITKVQPSMRSDPERHRLVQGPVRDPGLLRYEAKLLETHRRSLGLCQLLGAARNSRLVLCPVYHHLQNNDALETSSQTHRRRIIPAIQVSHNSFFLLKIGHPHLLVTLKKRWTIHLRNGNFHRSV